tara:strand:- start:2739 stop:2945 length:207 start_codon:yes stop_codon:yes gene_type:complete
MTLKNYIQKNGDASCAQVLQSKARTIKSWRLGERVPNRNKAKLIASLTEGEVSFLECYFDTEDPSNGI